MAARVAPAGDAAVLEVCRRLLLAGTPELLSPLPLPYGWDDLVISVRTERHLREVDAQARHRGEVLDDWGFSRLTAMGRGVTALFAGPSGTGKTMAAQVLAASLGLDLYRVDLAGVVSKYIGETEKHLREVFDACERAPVLLLFDEADALFGKRTEVSDAHDRYANIEVNYVLQRMEAFNGVAVLATNRKGDLDSAFVRRIQFIVDFAAPNAAERERLWRRALEGAAYPGGGPLVGSDRLGLARRGVRSHRRRYQIGGAGRGVPGAQRRDRDRDAPRPGRDPAGTGEAGNGDAARTRRAAMSAGARPGPQLSIGRLRLRAAGPGRRRRPRTGAAAWPKAWPRPCSCPRG